MSRSIGVLLVAVVFVAAAFNVLPADEKLKQRPLDLPSGGVGGDEEDEDAPEVITFYGSDYEGDGFFWCLDRSGSMVWGGAIAVLKQEMSRAINQLSAQSEFSIVSFSSNKTFWSERPQAATPSNKASAIAWVNSIVADGGTCLADGAVATIEIANQCQKPVKRVILVGDGVPYCSGPPSDEQNNQTILAINGANYQRLPIDCIFISSSEDGIQLFQAIAQANNGTFSNPVN